MVDGKVSDEVEDADEEDADEEDADEEDEVEDADEEDEVEDADEVVQIDGGVNKTYSSDSDCCSSKRLPWCCQRCCNGNIGPISSISDSESSSSDSFIDWIGSSCKYILLM